MMWPCKRQSPCVLCAWRATGSLIVMAWGLVPASLVTAGGVPGAAPSGHRLVETAVLPGVLDPAKWKTTGPVEFGPSEMDAPGAGAKALRVEVLLTPEARKARSFTGEIFSLPGPQDWSGYNRLVLWVYVEPSKTPRGGAVSMHLYNDDQVRRTTGPYVVPRGRWQEVTWDLTPMPRSSVGRIMVTQGVHRHNPGESDRNVFHFGRIELRRVEPPTRFRGWQLDPPCVAFCHVGYTPGGEKTAIFAGDVGDSVRLLAAPGAKNRPNKPQTSGAAKSSEVWRGKLRAVAHPRTGRFKTADFSAWHRPGRYVLVADATDGPVATEPFVIGPEVHLDAVRRVLDFYRAERCGDAAPGYHLPCHLDDGRVEPYEGMAPERFAPEVRALFGRHVDCTGGWHDAGDMAKFAYQEYHSAYQMLRLHQRGLRYQRPGASRDAVLDEAVWGVQYALKTLLPTGRHCDRPERVGQGVWTDNAPGNEDDRQVGLTTWRSVERYVAGMMVEALAARLVRTSHPDLAKLCLDQARLEAEAYLTGAMKDWRRHPSPLKYASVGQAFLELYRTTGEARYLAEAARCGDELAACQERSLAWNTSGVTGFWYEGPGRKHPYAGGSGDGRQAYFLAELCRACPEHRSWMNWYAALRIYARFYAAATAEHLAPYGVPAFSLHDGPGQPYPYWDMVRVLGEQGRRKLDFQFDRLARIGPRYLVRIRNANSALNTNAATLAAVADLAADPQAETLARHCFAWMLGRNPFSRSQVWGVGHRYRQQPQYVATHDEMPGGIACKGIDGRLDGDGAYHDEPFSDPLPRCVINEVCIAQAAYFLGAGRELAFSPRSGGTVRAEDAPAEVVARYAGTDEVAARAAVGRDGRYLLVLPGGAWYELACGPVRRRLFVASATDRRDFDLDLRREVAVSVRCPETIRPGVPLDVHVDVRRLGTGGQDARHRLALRLHNATCDRPTQTVDLAGKDSATVSFRLMPQRPCEPLLVLAVPDGELAKRGEWMGVVGAAE